MTTHLGPAPPGPGPKPPGPGMAAHLGPAPPGPGPKPPGPGVSMQAEAGVAVLEMPEILPAQCLILDEFLAPAEAKAMIEFALEQESYFQVSEVISPGVPGAKIDYEHRRSLVLMELGQQRDVIVNRLQACWPRILERLDHDAFVISNIEAQITASNHGDFFRCHLDNGQDENAQREITFVYFFHREPKPFHGGELRIYDSRRENGGYRRTENYRAVIPQQNQMVLFSSCLEHEITPVECPSHAFSDSRFTVNGWFHR
jgi:SM-20-related protein